MKARFPGAGEEFESAAFLALVEAAQSFDSSRNVHFATYARHRIRGALYDVYRELIGSDLHWAPRRLAANVRLAMGGNLRDA